MYLKILFMEFIFMYPFKSFSNYSSKNEVFLKKISSVNAKMKNVVKLTCQQFSLKILAWNIGLRHTLKHVCNFVIIIVIITIIIVIALLNN